MAGIDGQIAGLGVGDFILPAHAPIADGGDDFQVGSQGGDAHINPHLVVALAGAAMGYGVGPLGLGRLYQVAGDKGAAQGGSQGILLLVDGAGLQSGKEKLVDQGFPPVHGQGLGRAHLQGPFPDGGQIHHSQVNGQGDDVGPVFLL